MCFFFSACDDDPLAAQNEEAGWPLAQGGETVVNHQNEQLSSSPSCVWRLRLPLCASLFPPPHTCPHALLVLSHTLLLPMRHTVAAASPRVSPRVLPSPSASRRCRAPRRPPTLAPPRATPGPPSPSGSEPAAVDTHAGTHTPAADAAPRRPHLVGALAVDSSLDDRISSGEFTDAGSTKERATRPVRKLLAKDRGGPGESVQGGKRGCRGVWGGLCVRVEHIVSNESKRGGGATRWGAVGTAAGRGTTHPLAPVVVASSTRARPTTTPSCLPSRPPTGRAFALWLAQLGLRWRATAASRMPTATGDIREIVGQPVFVPLYRLFLTYGPIFRLAFGPKSFVVVSDPALAKQVLLTDAASYTKGLLSEILDFVMGTGLIPADGDVWRERRRAIVPALHRKYIASMLGMFGECALHGARTLEARVDQVRQRASVRVGWVERVVFGSCASRTGCRLPWPPRCVGSAASTQTRRGADNSNSTSRPSPPPPPPPSPPPPPPISPEPTRRNGKLLLPPHPGHHRQSRLQLRF